MSPRILYPMRRRLDADVADFACSDGFGLSAVASDHGDVVYENHYRTAFCPFGADDADDSSESGADWTGVVFNLFYYVAGVFGDQYGGNPAYAGGDDYCRGSDEAGDRAD